MTRKKLAAYIFTAPLPGLMTGMFLYINLQPFIPIWLNYNAKQPALNLILKMPLGIFLYFVQLCVVMSLNIWFFKKIYAFGRRLNRNKNNNISK